MVVMDYGNLSNAVMAAALRERRHQFGGDLLPHFRSSVSYQRGRGFGGLIRQIIRRVTPLFRKPIVRKGLKSIGKAAATAVLEAGQRSLQEDGPTFGPALKASSKKQAQALIQKAMRNQQGSGRKRKKGISRHQPPTKKRRVQQKLKPYRDIFG